MQNTRTALSLCKCLRKTEMTFKGLRTQNVQHREIELLSSPRRNTALTCPLIISKRYNNGSEIKTHLLYLPKCNIFAPRRDVLMAISDHPHELTRFWQNLTVKSIGCQKFTVNFYSSNMNIKSQVVSLKLQHMFYALCIMHHM